MPMTQLGLRNTHLVSGAYSTGRRTSAGFEDGLDLLRANLPPSTRLRALARIFLAIFTFVLFGASLCRAQGTYTAASCSRSDVNAVINGPTHTAVNGDTIIIPTTGSPCTWTSGITISGVGIDITGTGTPNTGGGTVGAGTPNTTLIDNFPGPYNSGTGGAFFTFTGLTASSSPAKVELLNLSASGAANLSILGPLVFAGSCTNSAPYCPSIRVDNINYTAGTWACPMEGGFVIINNVFGVVDHITTSENNSSCSPAGPPLTQISFASWHGVGDYGDNSFASADTFGSAQTIFIENNLLGGTRGSENDVPPPGTSQGGARYACRFNTITNFTGTGICSAHGTAWGGRMRGMRQTEVYYNTMSTGTNATCNSVDGILSGTGYYLSNSITAAAAGATGCNEFLSVDIARFIQNGAPWLACNGTEPWDQMPFSSTSACLDQPGRGAGTLLQGIAPLLVTTGIAGWPSPVLDPIYEAGEVITGGFGTPVSIASDGSSARVLFNRDVYAEVSRSAQSSPTSPFNGTAGTGYGTLANRPTTCTAGVGYWATDQGTWNHYNSQQGVLYTCNSGGNAWTATYTPYTYPHPLTDGGTTTTGGAPNPPTSLSAAVE
jgi:hypothetical protein